MVPLARYRYTARLKYLAYRAPRGAPRPPPSVAAATALGGTRRKGLLWRHATRRTARVHHGARVEESTAGRPSRAHPAALPAGARGATSTQTNPAPPARVKR